MPCEHAENNDINKEAIFSGWITYFEKAPAIHIEETVWAKPHFVTSKSRSTFFSD